MPYQKERKEVQTAINKAVLAIHNFLKATDKSRDKILYMANEGDIEADGGFQVYSFIRKKDGAGVDRATLRATLQFLLLSREAKRVISGAIEGAFDGEIKKACESIEFGEDLSEEEIMQNIKDDEADLRVKASKEMSLSTSPE